MDDSLAETVKPKPPQHDFLRLLSPFHLYLYLISGIGVLLFVGGLAQVPSYEPLANFVLLVLLAAVAETAATSVPISPKTGITYHIGPAVGMAAIPTYGPLAAVVIVVVANVSLWVLKPASDTWKKSWAQLFFNGGMESIAIYVAGLVLLGVRALLVDWSYVGIMLSWLVAAVAKDQVNFILLVIILRLQHGAAFKPFQMWRDNLWAASISVLVFAIGGGVLAFAVERYDWLGILIFFLPIVLSAYAFRLYVQQMQSHMENLEAIVAERTHELAVASEEKDAFLAVLTHDMKTPLTSIGLYASMIRENPELMLSRPHVAMAILRSQQTLVEIVDNILDLEKLGAGESLSLTKEQLNLVELVDYTVEMLAPQARDRGIRLSYEFDSSPVYLKGDRQQLIRVFLNLVSNAVKYTPEGGAVQVSLGREDGEVKVTVRDNGYGIPEDELPFIFDRYRRVKKHKSVAIGTGLGLAISKALVEAHHGRIVVVSEEGVGSSFTVLLPTGANPV